MRFCAFCRTPKKTYTRRHLSLMQILFVTLLSVAVTTLIRGTVDQYFLFLLFPQLMIGEMIVRMRYRGSLVCQSCGFDPVTYRRDYKKARSMVKETLEARRNDPSQMLKKPLGLPRISAARLERLQELEARVEELRKKSAEGSDVVLLRAEKAPSDVVGRLISKEV